MQAIFSLVIDDGVRSVDNGVGNFLSAGSGQRVHIVGYRLGKLEMLIGDAPILLELLAVLLILRLGHAVGGSDFEAESPEHKGALAEFSQWFQDEITADYGGINCEDIIGTNAAKRVEYCPQIIAATYEKCVEILQNRGLL